MNFVNIYNDFMKGVDSRVESWKMADSTTIPIIVLIYPIILFISSKYMENRPAYSLKTFIKCYNIFQVMANSFIIYRFIDGGWFEDISIYCVPISYATDPNAMKIASALWYVLLLKVIDLIETELFVLRKKNRQISVLHIYHHISTVLFTWIGVRYYAGGMASFFPLLNCSVHVIMYGYYFLSSLGPKWQKLINPYKSILTVIQIVQLVVLLLHLFQAFLPSCHVPKTPALIFLINIFINLILFLNFYQKNYKVSKTKNK